MNALPIMYMNAHLEEMLGEARRRRIAAPLTPHRSMRARVAALADDFSRRFGAGTPDAYLPTLKDYPYGG